MMSNEWHQWQAPMRRPYHQPYGMEQQPPPYQRKPEDTLKENWARIERKTFLMTLKENDRGRFLRISEETNGRRNSIIVPSAGLKDLQKMLDEMIQASNLIPAKHPTQDAPPPAQ
jgi:hypothetical protein